MRKLVVVGIVVGLVSSSAALHAAAAGTGSKQPDSATTTAGPKRTVRYTTSNTPIGTLAADPAARAVVEQYIPSLMSPEFLPLVSHTSLKGIQGYAYKVLTDDVLAQMDAQFAKLTPLSPAAGGGPVAGDVNYDEAEVGSYTLPDPLVLSNGKRVRDAETWRAKRRPEILRAYERLVYGRVPARPTAEHFEVVEASAPAFEGRAVRRQVVIHLAAGNDGPAIHLVEYVPASATGPVPMLLMLGFESPTHMFGDPEFGVSSIPAELADLASAFPTTQYLDAGFGVAGINAFELDPDSADGYPGSVRAYFDGVDEGDRPSDAWGAVAAWGWGLSRAQDYLQTDTAVDAKRVAIYGASRYGRAVLWAGARDQRFAAVVACCSGKFGGALLRRNFGDALDTLPDYWFAHNLAKYVHDIDELPVDSNLLLALIAPRPVLLQTGRYDYAGDPKGEYLATVGAGPVYELLGATDLGASHWPPSRPILNDVAYLMHDGGHGTATDDWGVFLTFLQRHLDR